MEEVTGNQTLRNARAYVLHWVAKNKIKARDARNVPTTFYELYLDYEELVRAARNRGEFAGKALAKDSLEMAYELYIRDTIKAERTAALEQFRFTGANSGALELWVNAMTGKTREIDVAIMRHWMWMVKRKSFNLPVKHHIMPVFYGPQGSGKTLGITALIKPYEEFVMNIKMDHLEDARNYQGMEDNYIIFFDELQKIQRTDMEVLKHQITGDYNTYRPLYKNHVINAKQNCSFIGATNKPMDESFTDTTGNRRFYELNTPIRCNWTAINTMDCKAIWLSIDENLEDGYLRGKMLEEVALVQQAMTKLDDVELYIQERGLRFDDKGTTMEIRNQSLYDDYATWCVRQGLKPYDLPFWSKRMKNSGIPQREERVNNRKKKFFIVSDKCDVVVIGAPVARLEKV